MLQIMENWTFMLTGKLSTKDLHFIIKNKPFLINRLSSANATPEFQGRGGDSIASQIVNILTNLFSTENFDLSQLCIVEGKKCWHLYIDIVVIISIKFSILKEIFHLYIQAFGILWKYI